MTILVKTSEGEFLKFCCLRAKFVDWDIVLWDSNPLK